MPTLLRQDGFTFRLYLDDHIPAHVHVHKSGGEVIIRLGGEGEAPTETKVYSMSNKDIRKALKIADEYKAYLRQKWEEYHG